MFGLSPFPKLGGHRDDALVYVIRKRHEHMHDRDRVNSGFFNNSLRLPRRYARRCGCICSIRRSASGRRDTQHSQPDHPQQTCPQSRPHQCVRPVLSKNVPGSNFIYSTVKEGTWLRCEASLRGSVRIARASLGRTRIRAGSTRIFRQLCPGTECAGH